MEKHASRNPQIFLFMLYMTRVRHEWGVLFMLFLLSRQNGLIAQVVVEQGTENACVGGANPSGSSIPALPDYDYVMRIRKHRYAPMLQ